MKDELIWRICGERKLSNGMVRVVCLISGIGCVDGGGRGRQYGWNTDNN